MGAGESQAALTPANPAGPEDELSIRREQGPAVAVRPETEL